MHEGHENKGNDRHLKKLLIVEQIPLISTLKKCIKNIHTDVRLHGTEWVK